jgi:flavin-dependent dehydrogenase
VKATTVGGTVAGLRGAAACVQAIVKGTSYWEKLALLRRELWVHSFIRKFLNPLDDRHYGEFLSSLNGRGSFLGGFSRDEVSSHFLPLLLKHPGFSLKGLRAMVK